MNLASSHRCWLALVLIPLLLLGPLAADAPPASSPRADKLPDGYTVVYLDTYTDVTPDKDGHIKGVIESNVDYYALFVEGVYIDKKPSFFTKNNFGITVDTDAQGKALSIPLYSADRKVEGRLGISHYLLLDAIPSVGKPVKLGVTIARRDADDPVKQTIDFLNSSETNTALKTYAASAIPYLSLIGTVAKQLYGMFAANGDKAPMLQHLPISLLPYDGTVFDKHTLRDTTVLIFRTDLSLDASKFSLDANGSILYDKNPFLGVRWVALRIQKFKTRRDYAGREWHSRYEQAVAAAIQGKTSQDYSQADRLLEESNILLQADNDFTNEDRNALATQHQLDVAALKKSVQSGMTVAEASAMVQRASVAPKTLSAEHRATSDEVTIAPGASVTGPVVVPGLLFQQMMRAR